jgi:hypothetical protein
VKKAFFVVGVAALFAGANALLFTGDFFDEDDFLVIAVLVGIGFAFGLAVGRAWALTLVLAWVPLILLMDDSEREISTLGYVLFVLGVTATFQAGGIAAGVVLRRRIAERG